MSEQLSVRAAADLLGVHVDTIRRWTDEGRLPETRTPGGHRRIPRAAVDQLLAGSQPDSSSSATTLPETGAPADQAWAHHALIHARYELDSTPERGWQTSLTDADREHSRENGRKLMGLLLEHVAGTIEEEDLWPQVRDLTGVYAEHLRDAGVPYAAALRAAMFFRGVLSDSTTFYPASGERPGAELALKVNTFTNEVQLAIGEAYGVGGPFEAPPTTP
ncbi:MAG: helix-turn-helix domain-containing protein [Bacteroidota bacterium]